MDGAVAVFDGVAGVEPQSETVWRQANKYKVPRICFINKMDRMGANFFRCVDMIRNQLRANPLVINIPIGSESSFKGIIDIVGMRALLWSNDDLGARYDSFPVADAPIDSSLKELALSYRGKLLESVVEHDEKALNDYFEGIEPSEERIKSIIRKATLNFALVPVLAGSAFKNKGVQTLLDAVVDYLPSPIDRPPIQGVDPDDHSIVLQRKSSDSEPFSALAFKIMTDPFVGSLTFARVYSGVLRSGDAVKNTVKNEVERIGRMVQMHANERNEIKEARSGDIVALIGLKDTFTGETLCDTNHCVILEKMDFPDPVIKIAIEPKTKADLEKMGMALNRLAREDPSLRYSRNEESGQTTIEGMGELHLEIVVDRMKREYKVDCNVGEPQVSYREALTSSAVVEYVHKKQSGGAGQFAKIKVEYSPLDTAASITMSDKKDNKDDFLFVSEIKGGSIPKEYVPGVEKGVQQIVKSGVIAGFPVVGMKATLLDGAFHDVDSSTLAFEIAGRAATREGLRKCKCRLMEPIMKVEVICPDDHVGEIIGDLNARRGQILDMGDQGSMKKVSALVPLSCMFQYVSTLRSMSRGRAHYTMILEKFDFVPPHIEKEIAAKFRPQSVDPDADDSNI